MLITLELLITGIFFTCVRITLGLFLIKKEGDRNLPLKGKQDWSPVLLSADNSGNLLEGFPVGKLSSE